MYSEPLAPALDCTVRFIAVREGFNDSDEATYVFVVDEHRTAVPVISETDGHIVMSSATDGAEIHYTLDGSEPTSESALYSEPLVSDRNRVYNAIALSEDFLPSLTGTLTVDHFKVVTPAAQYEKQHIVLSCDDAEAVIYYTTDSSAPTVDNGTVYSEPLAPTSDCTVRFIAVREGYNNSDEGRYDFALATHRTAAPVITETEERIVMMSATDGAEIHYTLDGSEPTAESTLYTGPFVSAENHTYKAIAFSGDLLPSTVTTFTVDHFRVPVPTAVYKLQHIVLSCPDTEATIYYTTNGDEPSSGEVYSEPLAPASDCTVRFIAVREGFNDSEEGTYEFAEATHRTAAPVIDEQDGRIVMTSATPGAEIHYTLDGSEPTAESAVYSEPIVSDCNRVCRAIAFSVDLLPSLVTTEEINHFKVPTPTARYEKQHIILSCEDAEATIYYTTNGDEPRGGDVYSEPLAPTSNCTVRFIAVREGYNDSDEGTSYMFDIDAHRTAAPVIVERDGRIEMTSATAAAEIHYTLDDSEPTAESALYSEPIVSDRNRVCRAIAFSVDLLPSLVTTEEINHFNVSTPTAGYEKQHIVLSCSDTEATIYYTTNGDEPRGGDVYSEPLAPTSNCTVRFIAVREGYNDSDEGTSYMFDIDAHRTAAPVIVERDGRIEMTSATAGAEIHYTLDGSEPTAESALYSEPIVSEHNLTYRAIAFSVDLLPSLVTTYTVGHFKVSTPTARYEKQHIVLSCPDPDATIYYTLNYLDNDSDDDSDPAGENARVYSGPLAPASDCTVRFIARREGYNDSDEGTPYEFAIDTHSARTPVLDKSTGYIVMTSDTEGAEIHHTFDGSEPTRESMVYNGPIPITRNFTVLARAYHEDLLPSGIAELREYSLTVPTPEAEYAARHLSLSCADSRATIFFTLYTPGEDGVPMGEEEEYSADSPLFLTEDCTVHFVGRLDGYNDSEENTYPFVLVEHTVTTPEFHINEEGRLEISCASPADASIYYTTDGNDPDTESILYNGAITLSGNGVYKAYGVHPDYFDSEVTLFEVITFNVSKPYGEYAAHHVSLKCDDTKASIYYVTGDADLLTDGILYESPIAVEDDCTFRFIARRTAYNDSEENEYTFRISDYRLPEPSVTPDYLNGVLTVKADMETSTPIADGLSIELSDGEWNDYGTEWSIELPRQAMPERVRVCAVSDNPDLYTSNIVVIEPEYYTRPELKHDGYSLTASETGTVEIIASTWPKLDDMKGVQTAELNVAVPALFEVTVRRVGNEKFPSEDTQFANTAYFDYKAEENDVPTAGSLNPDALPVAFVFMSNDDNDDLQTVTELCVATEISTESLEFVTANLSNLTYLDLDVTGLTVLPDGVFAPLSRLTTLTLPSALTESSAALEGADYLTTLRWNEPRRAIPQEVLLSAVNPNMLVWVSDETQAAGRTHNVVTTVGNGSPRARQLVVTEGYPFSTTDAFTAAQAEFSRSFTQITPAPGEGQGSGWETIALPFDVTEITHEEKGALIPFALYDGDRSLEAPKPFWLYEADTEDTWREATAISAGVPYIISMPNHKYYAEQFRLSGKVTFRGTDVEVTPQGSEGRPVKRPDGYEFYPVFMPLDDDMYNMALGMNAGRDDTVDNNGNVLLPGSAFVDDVKPQPMQAYMKTFGDERYLPVFGDGSSIGTLLADESLLVEAGNGTIRLFSGTDRTVAVFTTTGICMATVELRAAVPVTIDNLTPGIYIVAGHKVVVN